MGGDGDHEARAPVTLHLPRIFQRAWLSAAVLGVVYALLANLMWEIDPTWGSAYWPAAGVTFAALVRTPPDSPEATAPTRYRHLPVCAHVGPKGACQHRECRYHLAHRSHSEHQLVPSRDCALDVANEGPQTREEVAAVLGISDERLRQIEKRALSRLKRNKTLRRLHDESF